MGRSYSQLAHSPLSHQISNMGPPGIAQLPTVGFKFGLLHCELLPFDDLAYSEGT